MSTDNQKLSYAVARYFLSKPDQIHMKDIQDPPKENCQIFCEWLEQISETNYIRSQINNSMYMMYFYRKHSESTSLFKFSKETLREIHSAKEKDIELETILDYPFSYILIDTTRQLVFVQKNSYLSSKPSTIMNHLAKVINNALCEHRVVFKLSPITQKQSFWSAIEEHQGLVSVVEFDLLSPNFLGSTYETNEFLKDLKKDCNNDSTKIVLRSDGNSLTPDKNSHFLSNILKYITNGGGKWAIKSESKRITSEKSVYEVDISRKSVEEQIDGESELDWSLRQIEDIESDNVKDD